jgi:hypothetical protein
MRGRRFFVLQEEEKEWSEAELQTGEAFVTHPVANGWRLGGTQLLGV